MGLFSSILEKIGIGRAHAEPDSTAPTTRRKRPPVVPAHPRRLPWIR